MQLVCGVQFAGGIFYDTNQQPIEIKNGYKSFSDSQADQVLIAGVSGKKIRILGMTARAAGAVGGLVIKQAGSSTAVWRITIPLESSGDNYSVPMHEIGYIDSATGGALHYDSGNQAGYTGGSISFRYIEFTPPT